VAVKGAGGTQIGTASLSTKLKTNIFEQTLGITDSGISVSTLARVEPVPVQRSGDTNFIPRKKQPSTTTSTIPTSIEIALPD
jgi:hypothetical protein